MELLQRLNKSVEGSDKNSVSKVKSLRKVLSSLGMLLLEVAISMKIISSIGDPFTILSSVGAITLILLTVIAILDHISKVKYNKKRPL